MKTKKLNLNWQSVLLGIVLCMVLVVFVGNNANAQTTQTTTQTRVIQNAVTMNELLAKSEFDRPETRGMEKKIDRLREQMEYLLKNLEKE